MSQTSHHGNGLPISRAKVVALVNMIPPYRLPVFEALAHRVGKLLVWISTPMEPDRQWQPEWGQLNVEVQRSLTLRQSTPHPHGFLDKQFVHLPYDTIPRLRRARPDLVLTAELGLRTAQAALWCAATSTPLAMVVYVSESSERGRDRGRVRRMLRRILLKRADVVFVPGQSGARYVRGLGAHPDRIRVVFNVSPLKDAVPVEVGKDGGRRLLYVGQLIERKGIVPCVQALGRWGLRHPDERVSLRIVGAGPEAARLESLQLPGNVAIDVLAPRPYERMAEVYQTADVFVFPTLADVWGLVVNEAMSTGLPVLGSRHSQAVEELVEEGVNGWTFVPDRPQAVDEALERVLGTPPEQLARMGAAARDTVRPLTPEYVADGFAEGLDMALRRAARSVT
jgi:glycosyltransferase involved in cell wall biosynthesis